MAACVEYKYGPKRKWPTLVSEEEFSKIPYPVKFLRFDKKDKAGLRQYYRNTTVIFGREEKDGKVTVFINGEEDETLQMQRDFDLKYFTEAI